MEKRSPTAAEFDRILDAAAWSEFGTPLAALGELRERHPVCRYEGGIVDPFWMITRHADVEVISRDATQWLSGPRTTLQRKRGQPKQLNSLPQMDAPEHGQHRRIIQQWLVPGKVRQLEQRMQQISRLLVDRLRDRGGEVDLVQELAAPHPLRMICEMFGIPDEEHADVLRLSKSLFAPLDPDAGAGREYTMTIDEILSYCGSLVARRRANPSDDLVSAIVASRIDGEPIGHREILSHLVVLIAAGHDTTASAISGGILAMAENPDQWVKLRNEPELLSQAIDEIIRYVTPTTNFVRTAVEECVLHDVRIAAGDDVCLQYAAANRDPRVFTDPDSFLIDRSPNRHLAFGTGPHVCIGQILARIEMKTLFSELLARVDGFELTGPPRWMRAFWISALKTLPARCVFAS
ncbi:MAG TPA: cytochrome P450 [Bradyrhizobium sp.]|nr:cytochrome P450 [Bradyrhizobium sp.]